MNDWPALMPGILCTAVILLAPGCLALLACGVRRAKTLLGAPLVTFAIIGLASLLSTWAPWGLGLVLLMTCLICAAAIGVRAIANKAQLSPALKAQGSCLHDNLKTIGLARIGWFIVALAISAVGTFAIMVTVIPDTNSFVQGHDAAFHMSVVRSIVESGCASPIGAGSVMGPADALYPNAWHALTALVMDLFGTSISQSVWITVLVLLMFVLPCSACLLVSTLFKVRWGLSFLFAATLPVLASTSAASFAAFGPIYANLCGLAILPAAIAFAILACECETEAQARDLALTLLADVLGLGFAHPNTVFTLTLFLLPLLIAHCTRMWQRLGLVAALVTFWAACLHMSAFARTVNCLDRIGEDIEHATTLMQRFGIPYEQLSTIPALPLVASIGIVAVGSIIAVCLSKRWNNSWYLAALALLAALVACTLFPINWFSKIATGFWYRDYFRLAVMLAMFAFIGLAAVPELVLGHARDTGTRSTRSRGLLQVGGAVFAIALFALAASGFRSHCTDFLEETTATEAAGPIPLTNQRAEFCEKVTALVGDAAVLNNHNDASVWLYPIYGVNALAKGQPANQMGEMDEDYRLLVTSINLYGTDNVSGAAVRQAAERLGVEYLVQMNLAPDSTIEFSEDNTIGYTYHDAENEVTENTPGFELVLDQNGMRLWRLIPDNIA